MPRTSFPKPTWRTAVGVLLFTAVAVMAIFNRNWIIEALGLARAAQLDRLALALGVIMVSYLISSQVLGMALRSLGYRIGVLRLWGTALVAIVLSQSVPAGGVGSYAFLASTFKRHGVSSGHSALVASLEALSYAGAMITLFGFGLLYMFGSALVNGTDMIHMTTSIIASLVALGTIGGAVLLLTRPEEVLLRFMLVLSDKLKSLLHRNWSDAWVRRAVSDLHAGRTLIATRPWTIVTLVLIQLLALSGHSLALLLVLWSLGATASFAVVVAAFSVALITSTFNVLPGGGGTVETALVAALTQLSIGSEAVPAAILFRLLNFWLLLPPAIGCYYWLQGRLRRAATPVA